MTQPAQPQGWETPSGSPIPRSLLRPILIEGGAGSPSRFARSTRSAGRALGSLAIAVPFLALAFLGLGPRTGAYRTLTVLTGSMTPAYPPGSIIVIAPVKVWDVKRGDVITYNAPTAGSPVVTHRVVSIRQRDGKRLVVTKGDANSDVDPWIAGIDGDTLWKVRGSVPLVGKAIGGMRHPVARKVGLIGMPLLLAIVWMRDIWRTPSSQRTDEDDDGA